MQIQACRGAPLENAARAAKLFGMNALIVGENLRTIVAANKGRSDRCERRCQHGKRDRHRWSDRSGALRRGNGLDGAPFGNAGGRRHSGRVREHVLFEIAARLERLVAQVARQLLERVRLVREADVRVQIRPL